MTLLPMGSIPLYFLACRSICQVMRSKVSLCYHFHILKHLPSQFCIVYGYHVHLKPSSLQIVIYVYKFMVLLKPNFGKLNESHGRSKAHMCAELHCISDGLFLNFRLLDFSIWKFSFRLRSSKVIHVSLNLPSQGRWIHVKDWVINELGTWTKELTSIQ